MEKLPIKKVVEGLLLSLIHIWMISAHEHGESRILQEPFQDMRLSEVYERCV